MPGLSNQELLLGATGLLAGTALLLLRAKLGLAGTALLLGATGFLTGTTLLLGATGLLLRTKLGLAGTALLLFASEDFRRLGLSRYTSGLNLLKAFVDLPLALCKGDVVLLV